ncbi:hypothetical protein PQR02_18930 [Paraburkholderia sediminicola]|uniref:Uncharacterized protein n=1 Tax=Paraburkholderia rhynchosiae TaxID=487049 RepID=A0ACC7NAT0_9BURK
MGIRWVAVALAAWCVSAAAMAAGYAEVWNPPEASGHVAKHATKKPGAGVKAGSEHGANAGYGAPRVASAAAAGHGSKLAAHGGVRKVAAKSGAAHGAKAPATANKPKAKAAVMALTKKPHAQLVRTQSGQGKVGPADLTQPRATHPHVTKVAAKPAAVGSANAPAMSANVSAGSADAATNPATVSGGSLPPLIH